MDKERLLNIKEAAAFLGKSEDQIKDLVKENKLVAYQIGGMYLRFKLEHLQNFKNSKEGKLQTRQFSMLDNIRDFFYFNDFYILALLVIAILLFIILKNIS